MDHEGHVGQNSLIVLNVLYLDIFRSISRNVINLLFCSQDNVRYMRYVPTFFEEDTVRQITNRLRQIYNVSIRLNCSGQCS